METTATAMLLLLQRVYCYYYLHSFHFFNEPTFSCNSGLV